MIAPRDLAFALGLLGAAPAPAQAAGQPAHTAGDALAPLDQEATPVGYRWFGRRGAAAVEILVISRDGELETFGSPDGCQWVHARGDRFAPNVRWSGCASPDGSQRVTREGDGFPLAPGARWQYHFEGGDLSGETWKGVRECFVQGALEVEIHDRTRRAHRVMCRDPWRFMEWHVVPGDNISVRSITRDRATGTSTVTEYVRHEAP